MRKYRSLIVVIVLVLVVAVYYIACSIMAAKRHYDAINKTYWSKQEERGDKEMYRVPGYHDLLKEKGMLEGLVQLAKSDSIGMFLNFPDSVAQLMVKGVAVHSIPIKEIRAGAFFTSLAPEALYDLLSGPFSVIGSKATIPKEPINVVNAPKDSSEVTAFIKPDTTHSEPVFIIIDTDKQLRFYIYQMEDNWLDKWACFRFMIDDRWNEARKVIKAAFTFNIPEYIPTVCIGVSKKDAKVLYRALPSHGSIVMTK